MSEHILEMKNITKLFPGVRALDKVNLQVKEGEIHALVGENGAGKSTLMKVLSGVHPYGSYEGEIFFNNEECKFKTIKDSEEKGIAIIHQELALIPYLSIGENIFLGNERGNYLSLDWEETYCKADELLETVGLDESSKTQIKDIGIGKQQMVEIAKALAKDVKLLILDEPTASLNEQDSQKLLDLLLEFKKEGLTSIIISHKLNEVSYVADTITIIRDGATIETLDNTKEKIDEDLIIKGMVGRELADRFPKRKDHKFGDINFEVKNWTVHHHLNTERKVVDDVSLNVRKSEVVGVSGLMGSGRTELARSIFGKSYGNNISGTLKINNEEVELNTVRQAIDAKIAYITEDRKDNGLILSNSIRVNTTLAKLDKVANKRRKINGDLEVQVANEYVDRLNTRCTSTNQEVDTLSGGNQQKVLLSKWMFTDPDILILDEPTRGIDVGAKYEIHSIINDLVKEEKSIIIISSEMPELLGMCDRIYVMNEGKIVGEFVQKEATQEKIMSSILKN